MNEISGLMIDFNLLQQNRLPYLEISKKNNIRIFAGTSICQGFLLSSPFKLFCKTKSPFYLARALFKKETRNYLKDSRILRNYLKKNHKDFSQEIPLSYVATEKNIDFIPVGMLSKSSILRNIEIVKNPVKKTITDQVASWAYENCQIIDNFENN